MHRLLLLVSLTGTLWLAGCRKADLIECDPVPDPTNSESTLTGFVRRNGVPTQLFTLASVTTSSGLQGIRTAAGAVITVSPASLLLPNGTAATGPVELRVREIYTVPDMLLSGMPTQTAQGRQLLVSGGEFSIQFWQNGTRLRLAVTDRVTVTSPQPVGAGSNQLLWQQPARWLRTDSTGWLLASRDSVRVLAQAGQLLYQLPIPLDSVSWWNIDRLWPLYGSGATAAFTVRAPVIAPSRANGTWMFLRPVGYNGLLRVYPSGTSNEWAGTLPSGAVMKAAVLQAVNGQLYYGTQAFTTQNGLAVAPTLTAVSEAQAVQLIRQL